jgi:uncharacterized membrane protein YciS (DUF1049 family)
MLRYVLFILVVLLVFFIAVVFAASNPGTLTLDLAFTRFEIQKSLAFILFLGVGWLFGVLCAGFLMLKMLAERRQVRKALELAEAEVKSLRSMPMQDANCIHLFTGGAVLSRGCIGILLCPLQRR